MLSSSPQSRSSCVALCGAADAAQGHAWPLHGLRPCARLSVAGGGVYGVPISQSARFLVLGSLCAAFRGSRNRPCQGHVPLDPGGGRCGCCPPVGVAWGGVRRTAPGPAPRSSVGAWRHVWGPASCGVWSVVSGMPCSRTAMHRPWLLSSCVCLVYEGTRHHGHLSSGRQACESEPGAQCPGPRELYRAGRPLCPGALCGAVRAR